MKSFMGQTTDAERKWWVVDATDKTLGRLATQIANVLRGKNKPTFTPHADMGDFVVVLNSKKIKLSGNKWDEKIYYRHSRFFGSMKETPAIEQIEKDPTHVIEHAVRGMLPKNRLARKIIKKLKVYEDGHHPHSAQKPEALNI